MAVKVTECRRWHSGYDPENDPKEMWRRSRGYTVDPHTSEPYPPYIPMDHLPKPTPKPKARKKVEERPPEPTSDKKWRRLQKWWTLDGSPPWKKALIISVTTPLVLLGICVAIICYPITIVLFFLPWILDGA